MKHLKNVKKISKYWQGSESHNAFFKIEKCLPSKKNALEETPYNITNKKKDSNNDKK